MFYTLDFSFCCISVVLDCHFNQQRSCEADVMCLPLPLNANEISLKKKENKIASVSLACGISPFIFSPFALPLPLIVFHVLVRLNRGYEWSWEQLQRISYPDDRVKFYLGSSYCPPHPRPLFFEMFFCLRTSYIFVREATAFADCMSPKMAIANQVKRLLIKVKICSQLAQLFKRTESCIKVIEGCGDTSNIN